MSTKILSFNFPPNPHPSTSNTQAVLRTSDSWVLTVKRTGADRTINVTGKTVVVSVTTPHYNSFCAAFQGSSGSVTVTYSEPNVQSIKWGSTTVVLPDVGSIAPMAMAPDAPDEPHDSTRLTDPQLAGVL